MEKSKRRITNETDVEVKLNIYGSRKIKVNTPIGFFSHMLELLAFHANFDLEINATGDTEVDAHHLVEDVGIVLGELLDECLNKQGIKRYGQSLLPMDETLVLVAIDLSSRSYLSYNVVFSNEWFKGMASENIEDFFQALTRMAKINLHFNVISQKNNHHLAEAMFKGVGRAIKDGCMIENDEINSTKGYL